MTKDADLKYLALKASFVCCKVKTFLIVSFYGATRRDDDYIIYSLSISKEADWNNYTVQECLSYSNVFLSSYTFKSIIFIFLGRA